MKRSALLIGWLTLFANCAQLWSAEANPAGIQFFESKIRPVLAERCYACHSVTAKNANKLQGKLLLDTRASMLRGGESGPAVVPGNVEKSLLIGAIRHESFEMPPKSKLSKEVIEDFVKWVEMGAPDPREGEAVALPGSKIDLEQGRKFWSFQPLNKAAPPQVKQQDRVLNEIDRFILARQEAVGLTINPAADRRTLIRRLYFDLWGLPPTPADVESFVNDPAPNAYQRLVDRLLQGDHFGERWARFWLDLARFAESNGYAFDKDRPAAYHYRDFVIKAFNDDMPYDQFVRWQLAGDQLEPDDRYAQAATGFLAAGPFTSQQTQKERERSRYEQLDDLISTIGTSMLGLTLGCARCHDHKFDPVGQYDYYRMVSCFAQTGFQDYQYDLNPEKYRREKAAFDAAHKPFVEARTNYERAQLPDLLSAWEAGRSAEQIQPVLSDWHVIGPFAAESFDKAYDQQFPPEKKVELEKTYQNDKLRWVAQPDWKDGVVHNTLQGENSSNYLFRTIDVPTAMPLEISLGRDDAIKVFLNGKSVLQQKVMGGAAANQDKVKLNLKSGRNELLLKIVNAGGPSGFYFKAQDTTPPKAILAILDLEPAKRDDKQKQALLKWFAPFDPGWQKLNEAEQEHSKQQPKQDLLPIFAASKGGATYNFGPDTRKVYFLARGNCNQKKGQANPGFMRVLMQGDSQDEQWTRSAKDSEPRPPRIAFADWLTDTDRGAGVLLARVLVNRLWQHHFGRGIVGTPSDFGTQGFRPTHPELLDYLAAELIRNGWKMKPIHRLIVTSATYRQNGVSQPAGVQQDPENKLWWRRGATRLEAEIIRDSLLAISGSLDARMYGEGSLNQEDPRRSVYLTVKRSKLIPFLQLFDAPDAMQGIGERNTTTVPPQALSMMNSGFVRKHAEKFVKRIRPDDKQPLEATIDSAYAIALGRSPTDQERQQMLQFVQGQAKSYGDDAKATETAVADFCQLLFCLNEFVFID